jgi:hypothetical protein
MNNIIDIKATIRQNAYEKTKFYSKDFLSLTNPQIMCPYSHSIDIANEFISKSERNDFINNQYKINTINKFYKLNINDNCLIPFNTSYDKKVLIVKITSDIKYGEFIDLKYICKKRDCFHKNIINTCTKCNKSIKSILPTSQAEKEVEINERIEPFICIYFDIEIIKNIERNDDITKLCNRRALCYYEDPKKININ